MKQALLFVQGIIGYLVGMLYGGWTTAMTTLLIFMLIDLAFGFVAGIEGKSKKALKNGKITKNGNGKLSSDVMFWGLIKKCLILLLLIVGHRLDLLLGGNGIKDALCYAFSANEVISIIENAGLIGLWVPNILKKVIAVLQEKGKENEKED